MESQPEHQMEPRGIEPRFAECDSAQAEGASSLHSFIVDIQDSDAASGWEIRRKPKRQRKPKPKIDYAQLLLFERAPSGWFQTPNALTEEAVMTHLTKAAIQVYLDLRRRRRDDSPLVDPSHDELRHRLKLGDGAVSSAFVLLASMRMIRLDRERTGYRGRRRWILTPPSEWRSPTLKGGEPAPEIEGKSVPDFEGKSVPDFEGKSVPDFEGKSVPDFEELGSRFRGSSIFKTLIQDKAIQDRAQDPALRCDALVEELIEKDGFARPQAFALVRHKHFSPERLAIGRLWVEYHRSRRKLRSGPGVITYAIAHPDQPPPPTPEQLHRERVPDAAALERAARQERDAAEAAVEAREIEQIKALAPPELEALIDKAIAGERVGFLQKRMIDQRHTPFESMALRFALRREFKLRFQTPPTGVPRELRREPGQAGLGVGA